MPDWLARSLAVDDTAIEKEARGGRRTGHQKWPTGTAVPKSGSIRGKLLSDFKGQLRCWRFLAESQAATTFHRG